MDLDKVWTNYRFGLNLDLAPGTPGTRVTDVNQVITSLGYYYYLRIGITGVKAILGSEVPGTRRLKLPFPPPSVYVLEIFDGSSSPEVSISYVPEALNGL